jgi:hypothetical protein
MVLDPFGILRDDGVLAWSYRFQLCWYSFVIPHVPLHPSHSLEVVPAQYSFSASPDDEMLIVRFAGKC